MIDVAKVKAADALLDGRAISDIQHTRSGADGVARAKAVVTLKAFAQRVIHGCPTCGGSPVTPAGLDAVESKEHSLPDEAAAIVAWLRRENEICDCAARSEGECACGAWYGSKDTNIPRLADAIERGAHLAPQK